MAAYSPVSDQSDPGDRPVSPFAPEIRRKPLPQVQYEQLSSRPVRGPVTAKKNPFFKSWLLELLSCCLALLALVAIIITLRVHNGSPIPEWPKLITVNSLIAIFTAILKAAMILPVAESIGEHKWLWYSKPRPLDHMEYFDSASRGPLGSLNLLRAVPKAFFPCLGAVITICALAIDPFTQQIIQYYNCPALSSETSKVSRINEYDISLGNPNTAGYILDDAMTATLYQGLIDPPTNATVGISTTCRTGNCSFPSDDNISYHSLAICSQVTDITSTIATTSEPDAGEAFWAFALPSGIEIQGPGRGGYTAVSVTVDDLGDSFINKTHPPLYAFEFLTATYPDRTVVPRAFRAEMAPCINSYSNGRISDSILTETIVSSNRLTCIDNTTQVYFSLVGEFPATPGVDCSPSSQRQDNKTQPTHVWSDGSRFVSHSGWTSDSDGDTLWYDPACAYELALGPTDALRTRLSGLFGTNSSDGQEGIQWQGVGTAVVTGPNWLKAMFSSGDGNITTVEKTVQGLTNAMTAHIRRTGTGQVAVGAMYTTETCIRVQWAWLALPASLLGLTLVFLIVTIWQSQRERNIPSYPETSQQLGPLNNGRQDAWKSSALPLIWCGLDDDVRSRHGYTASAEEMEKHSRTITVQLAEKQSRLSLVRVDTDDTGIAMSSLRENTGHSHA